ncbi:MAG: hypothetical protein EBR62_09580, partial [Verrucomicrobia bacterium]|nr:hypothetical protein [Verrucomicrobiota bacterium]
YGIPSSSSHALIGGLAGAAVTKGGISTVIAAGFLKTAAAIVLSPLLGFFLGSLLMIIVAWLFRRSTPRRVDRPLVGLGVEDQAAHRVAVVVAPDQLAGQPAQQFGVGHAAALEITGLVDESPAHQPAPEPVHHDLGKALVGRRRQQGRQAIPGIVRVARQLVGRAFRRELREGPVRLDRGPRGQRDLDEGFAPAFAELVHRHAAGGRDLDALGLEQGGQGEDLFLLGRRRRRVVATRALGVHAEEGGGQHRRLGRHRDVVLRGHAESRRPAEAFAALQPDEFGDHQVERLAVEEALMQPPAERAGVVEGRVQDVGVLGEHVLPIAHAGVGRARVGEQAID